MIQILLALIPFVVFAILTVLAGYTYLNGNDFFEEVNQYLRVITYACLAGTIITGPFSILHLSRIEPTTAKDNDIAALKIKLERKEIAVEKLEDRIEKRDATIENLEGLVKKMAEAAIGECK